MLQNEKKEFEAGGGKIFIGVGMKKLRQKKFYFYLYIKTSNYLL